MRRKARAGHVTSRRDALHGLGQFKARVPVDENLLQLPEKCRPALGSRGPVLQTVWEEGSSAVFHGLGAQFWVAGWQIPCRVTGQGLPTRGTEDKVKERNPRGPSVGKIPLPSVTKTGGSRHLLLFLQIKTLLPPPRYPDLLRSIPGTEFLETNRFAL